MKKSKQHYNLLAEVFRYPKEGYLKHINDCGQMLKNQYPEAFEIYSKFLNRMNEKTLFEAEELFSQTFHIQAICYLDLGYVLFAEDFKRGDFLVEMKKEQRKANNDCGEELADNLPNVLSLLPLLEDEEFLGEMGVRIIIPSLTKMLKEFDSSRMALKTKLRKKKQKVIIAEDMKHQNLYRYAIEATLKVFEKDFEGIHYNDEDTVATLSGAFLPNCGSNGCAN